MGLMKEARLRPLSETNVVGILVANDTGTVLEANNAFLGMIGYTREELEQGLIDWRAITPPQWLPLDELAIDQMGRTGIIPQYEKEYRRKDGSRVPVSLGGAGIAGTGEHICYVVDLSEIRRTRTELERSESRFARSEQRYRFLTDALPQVIMMSDAQRKLSYANKHYEAYTGITSSEIASRWRDAIHPDDLASIDAARARGTQYEIEYRLRRVDGVYRWHVATTYAIPDEAGGNGWLATAIDIDDRKRAEESLRFLEKAGARLAQSLDLRTTFDTILDLIVPEFGDWATIMLRNDDHDVRTVVACHRDSTKAHLVTKLVGAKYFREDYGAGALAVYRTGKAAFQSSISREFLVASVEEHFVPIFEELGYESMLALPIVCDANVTGSITIIATDTRRRYTSADLPGLEELARRAGFAIANSRSYEREHRVAHILQAAALPQALPSLSGLRFDSYYRAGRSEALIGGDWFDAVVIADGRVMISVGDVAGSGLHAAVQMSNVRRVIRAAAHFAADPLTILDIADRTLREESATIVTAFVGIIDVSNRIIHFASAGHLPALLRTADGAISELEAPGLPLGCRDLAAGESRSAQLPASSCLVLYTDGLVELSRDVLEGEAKLRESFAAITPQALDRPAQSLVQHMLRGVSARDDVAALMVVFA